MKIEDATPSNFTYNSLPITIIQVDLVYQFDLSIYVIMSGHNGLKTNSKDVLCRKQLFDAS